VVGKKGARPFWPRQCQAGAARRRLCRGAPGRHRRRTGGDLGELPDRRGKQPEGRAQGFCRRSAAMIARLIAWSARNLLLVLFGAGFATAAGLYALAHLPLDAIPDLSDTQVI